MKLTDGKSFQTRFDNNSTKLFENLRKNYVPFFRSIKTFTLLRKFISPQAPCLTPILKSEFNEAIFYNLLQTNTFKMTVFIKC